MRNDSVELIGIQIWLETISIHTSLVSYLMPDSGWSVGSTCGTSWASTVRWAFPGCTTSRARTRIWAGDSAPTWRP